MIRPGSCGCTGRQSCRSIVSGQCGRLSAAMRRSSATALALASADGGAQCWMIGFGATYESGPVRPRGGLRPGPRLASISWLNGTRRLSCALAFFQARPCELIGPGALRSQNRTSPSMWSLTYH
jgi:hypothetical protein